jgi:hypothetical protein
VCVCACACACVCVSQREGVCVYIWQVTRAQEEEERFAEKIISNTHSLTQHTHSLSHSH